MGTWPETRIFDFVLVLILVLVLENKGRIENEEEEEKDWISVGSDQTLLNGLCPVESIVRFTPV